MVVGRFRIVYKGLLRDQQKHGIRYNRQFGKGIFWYLRVSKIVLSFHILEMHI